MTFQGLGIHYLMRVDPQHRIAVSDTSPGMQNRTAVRLEYSRTQYLEQSDGLLWWQVPSVVLCVLLWTLGALAR